MIVVVCVLMVTMILCLTIVVGAYQTLSSVGDTRRDTAAYHQALSFSEALKEEIVATGAPVPTVPENDLKKAIVIFATDETLFGDGPTAVEEPSRTLRTDPLTPRDSHYSDLRLTLRKRKAGEGKCKLFIVTEVLEEERVVSSCTAGYDVAVRGASGSETYDMEFKAYY